MPERAGESAAGQLPLTRWQQVRSRIRHVLENRFYQTCFPGLLIRKKYAAFQRLCRGDRRALELISAIEEIGQKRLVCDPEHIRALLRRLDEEVRSLVEALVAFNPGKYALLRNYHRKYAFYADMALMEKDPGGGPGSRPPFVRRLSERLDEDAAGGKGVILSRLLREGEVPVPPGLVVTPAGFHLLLAANRLKPLIQEELSRLGPHSQDRLAEVSQTIRSAVLAARKPPSLEEAVGAGLKTLGISETPLALRSSAVGEDLQASFAGQFESLLDISPADWFSAYKRVAASKYSPHALYYRMSRGFSDGDMPMAVLIMPFLQAAVSGILYTRRPDRSGPDPSQQAVLYMVSGTGESLAGGSECKAWAVFSTAENRLEGQEGPALLSAEQLIRLFQLGLRLEADFGSPQDVEWVVDREGRISILQSRPLRKDAAGGRTAAHGPDRYRPEEILGRGKWVSSGCGSGSLYRLESPDSIAGAPPRSILLTRELPPELAPALEKAEGIIAEMGSPACHFASLAREAGVPVICNATGHETIGNGQMVSLDSEAGVILSGARFRESSAKPPARAPGSPVMEKLSRALPHIASLCLSDPGGPDFSIRSCRSLHDIVRYVHEAGVREMFSLVGRRGLTGYGAKRLVSGLPLVLHVLDVENGLSAEGKSRKTIAPEHIASRPMKELLAGLSSPAVQWDAGILHYDWEAYSRNTAAFVDVEKSTMFSSYAILDREYLHALLRFGYHFAVVDAVAGLHAQQNYLHFSFKGGGGNETQRMLRLELIQMILEHFQFKVKAMVDLLEAALDRQPQPEIAVNLQRLGIVLGKTVLMDMRLKEADPVETLAAAIIEEIYDLLPFQKNP